jgi:hypothetical protein
MTTFGTADRVVGQRNLQRLGQAFDGGLAIAPAPLP